MSESIRGFLTHVSDQLKKDDWTMQILSIKADDGTKEVKIWTRPDLSGSKGKYIEIDGLEWKPKKKGSNEKQLTLSAGQGSISVKDVTPRGTAPTTTTAPDTRRTMDEYFDVLDRVIRHVRDAFNSPGTIVPDQQAIAHVVNGTMVAFVKGEFVVEKDINPEYIDPIVI